MVNIFAGAITGPFPPAVTAVLLVVEIVMILAVIVGIIAGCLILRSLLRTRSNNAKTKKSSATSNGPIVINDFLGGAVIDILFVLAAVFIYQVATGKLNQWSNDIWHTSVMAGAIIYFLLRLLSRTIFKRSLGEMMLKAKRYSKQSYLLVSLIDLALAAAVFLYVHSL